MLARIIHAAALGLVLALLAQASAASASNQTSALILTGSVNNNLKIEMSLEIKANKVKGQYRYLPKGGFIPLVGIIRPDGGLLMREYGKNKTQTGLFDGRITGRTIRGAWKSPDGSKNFPFLLKAKTAIPEPIQEKLKTLNVSIPLQTQIKNLEDQGLGLPPKIKPIQSPETFDYIGVGANTLFSSELPGLLKEKMNGRPEIRLVEHISPASAEIYSWDSELPRLREYQRILKSMNIKLNRMKLPTNLSLMVACQGDGAHRKSELRFSRFSGKPLDFHIRRKDPKGELLQKLRSRYGPPETLSPPAAAPGLKGYIWNRYNDMLVYVRYKSDVFISIHFLNNLEFFLSENQIFLDQELSRLSAANRLSDF